MPLSGRPQARAVLVSLDALLPHDGSSVDVGHGLKLRGWATGTLHRWLRSSRLAARFPDGGAGRSVGQDRGSATPADVRSVPSPPGRVLDLERTTAVHEWHLTRGAVWEDVGQWGPG